MNRDAACNATFDGKTQWYPKSIGFTGTRAGMSVEQKKSTYETLLAFTNVNLKWEFHHGDCVGADAEAHDLVREHFPNALIVGHPGVSASGKDKDQFRAHKKCDEEQPAASYLARNRIIVISSYLIIGCPFESTRPKERAGGTWYTIDYGHQRGRKTATILRSGECVWRDMRRDGWT